MARYAKVFVTAMSWIAYRIFLAASIAWLLILNRANCLPIVMSADKLVAELIDKYVYIMTHITCAVDIFLFDLNSSFTHASIRGWTTPSKGTLAAAAFINSFSANVSNVAAMRTAGVQNAICPVIAMKKLSQDMSVKNTPNMQTDQSSASVFSVNESLRY